MQATHVRSLISKDFKKVYESGVDFILCPTASGILALFCYIAANALSGVAPLLSEAGANANKAESFLNDVFTVPASLAGTSHHLCFTSRLLTRRGRSGGYQRAVLQARNPAHRPSARGRSRGRARSFPHCLSFAAAGHSALEFHVHHCLAF